MGEHGWGGEEGEKGRVIVYIRNNVCLEPLSLVGDKNNSTGF